MPGGRMLPEQLRGYSSKLWPLILVWFDNSLRVFQSANVVNHVEGYSYKAKYHIEVFFWFFSAYYFKFVFTRAICYVKHSKNFIISSLQLFTIETLCSPPKQLWGWVQRIVWTNTDWLSAAKHPLASIGFLPQSLHDLVPSQIPPEQWWKPQKMCRIALQLFSSVAFLPLLWQPAADWCTFHLADGGCRRELWRKMKKSSQIRWWRV